MRHVELEIVSELRAKVWVDTAQFFEIMNGISLVCIEAHQSFDYTHLAVFTIVGPVELNPLSEATHKAGLSSMLFSVAFVAHTQTAAK